MVKTLKNGVSKILIIKKYFMPLSRLYISVLGGALSHLRALNNQRSGFKHHFESPSKRKFQKENEIKKNFGYPWGFRWAKCFNPIKRLKRKSRRSEGSYWLVGTAKRTTKNPISLEPKHWWMEGFGSNSFRSYTWPWTRKTENEIWKSQNIRIWKACRSKKSTTVSFKWDFCSRAKRLRRSQVDIEL